MPNLFRRPWRRLVAAVLLPSTMVAVGLAAEVSPPNPVPIHRLIRVKLAEGERAWVLAADFSPVDLARTADGGLVWTGPPGRYVILAFTAESQSQSIVTIGNAPGPPPEPDPGPDPQPQPDPASEFAKWVRSQVGKVPVASRPRAAAIGRSYLAVADRCGVDLFTPVEIRAATRDAVKVAVGGDAGDWLGFFQSLADELFKWDGQSSRSWRDYQATWRQIADGMK